MREIETLQTIREKIDETETASALVLKIAGEMRGSDELLRDLQQQLDDLRSRLCREYTILLSSLVSSV